MDTRSNAYMGSPVELGTGSRGEVANARLIAHGKTLERALHKVTDRIYCQMGSSLGNSAMILGDSGMIVVDTGDCVEQSQEQLADFRTVTDRPVSALVYTHGHYALGSRTYVPAGQDDQVPIYGHKDMLQVMSRTVGDLAPFLTRRVAMQFGFFLPADGPDAMPNQGLGKVFFELDRYKPTSGFVRPNRLMADGEEAVIDGVRFQFWDAPADSEDTVLIWLPEHKTVINNIAWPVMFNIYTLRGEMFRNPLRLLPGLDRILALEPEHLVGVHGVPISGKEAIRQAVTEYRDCIQFTYDQVCRGINMGLSPDELVAFVQLPDALANGRLTGQFYGELPFYVRQIYTGLVGWFGTDTVELHALPRTQAHARWTELAGGVASVVTQAQAAMARREFAWAAELATAALHTEPGSTLASQLKADALRAMGQVTTAANTRSWFLTQARELEGAVDTHKLPVRFVNATMVAQMPPGTYVNALRFRLDPGLSAGGERQLALRIGATDFGLRLRNGVVVVQTGAPAQADVSVVLTSQVWGALVAGDIDADQALAQGVTLEGDAALGRAVLQAWR
ncbi:alkyl sulfatase dimerization domain-containing protein [Acidovorax sp.]|uniref:alkyl sulfatase dimerization domain-containing protein n=1 Tax=Acidovorax sp. TaxID=1872122 RepID=UPI0026018DED|nr:alkyl sulfatase dimerization domain-containing protein [Acidovorax sp.]